MPSALATAFGHETLLTSWFRILAPSITRIINTYKSAYRDLWFEIRRSITRFYEINLPNYGTALVESYPELIYGIYSRLSAINSLWGDLWIPKIAEVDKNRGDPYLFMNIAIWIWISIIHIWISMTYLYRSINWPLLLICVVRKYRLPYFNLLVFINYVDSWTQIWFHKSFWISVIIYGDPGIHNSNFGDP